MSLDPVLSTVVDGSIPFVSLHNHTCFSVFDGFGYPEQFIDEAYKNGLSGLAFTDHGNMNNLAHVFKKAKEMKKRGKKFKIIYGIEAYIHPNIELWKAEKENHTLDAKLSKEIDSDEESIMVEDEEDSKKINKSSLNRRHHIVLLAQNNTGLTNLFKLVSLSYKGENYYRFPRIDLQMLKEHSDGIIMSSACLASMASYEYFKHKDEGEDAIISAMFGVFEKYMSIFGDRMFGELQWNMNEDQHKINQYIIKLSKQMGFKLISTCDAHFPSREYWKDREIYKLLGWLNKKRDDININDIPLSLEEMQYELYPKNGKELFEYYKKCSSKLGYQYDDLDIMQSIINTNEIAINMIEDFDIDVSVKLPTFVVPQNEDENQVLRDLALKGLRSISKHEDPVYVDRIEEELAVIKNRKFARYFLTMKLLSDKAQAQQLISAGRGSAAGSLLVYCLGITQLDPIKYNLQFSRFLRSGDTGYPDIDFDVENPAEFKLKLAEEYGEYSVVPISNFNTLKIKSLIKNIAKLYNVEFQEVNEITTAMDKEAISQAKEDNDITSGAYTPTWEEYKKYSPSLQNFLTKYPDVAEKVERLQGQISSIGKHAGGTIFSENLNERMPLITSKGLYQTPWVEGQTIRLLEPMGFIKYDILGIKTLRAIHFAIENILHNQEGKHDVVFDDIKKWYDLHLNPSINNADDIDVYRHIFHEGNWAYTYQFSNSGAQNLCQKAKPESIVDLAAITSIYRPGPLSANVDKLYIKSEGSETTYAHECLRPILDKTRGFILFQEQISSIANVIGKDITLDEGNELRKVLTKKGTGKEDVVKEKIFKKFHAGCAEKGMGDEEIGKLWKTLEFFSGYGFNKCLSFSQLVTIYTKEGEEIVTKKLGEVLPGDYVKSRDEVSKKDIFVKVNSNHHNGKKKVYKFILSGGKTIKCTMDHKFRTVTGEMLPMSEIVKNNLEIVEQQ